MLGQKVLSILNVNKSKYWKDGQTHNSPITPNDLHEVREKSTIAAVLMEPWRCTLNIPKSAINKIPDAINRNCVPTPNKHYNTGHAFIITSLYTTSYTLFMLSYISDDSQKRFLKIAVWSKHRHIMVSFFAKSSGCSDLNRVRLSSLQILKLIETCSAIIGSWSAIIIIIGCLLWILLMLLPLRDSF